MAGDGGLELQKAIYAVLSADTALTVTLGAGVYDFVPKSTDLPYVTIGDDSPSWDGTMSIDWSDVTVTIHSWAGGEGHGTVKQLMSAVYDALHKVSLTITGKTHVETLFQNADSFEEEDASYHGVQRFRVIMHDPF